MGDIQCSFCGKPRREVKKLISGPRVFICDECVGLCAEIIAEESRAADAVLPADPARLQPRGSVILDAWRELCLATLDCKIIWPTTGAPTSRAQSLVGELFPEAEDPGARGSVTVIQVRELDRARSLLRASELFADADDEEIRNWSQARLAIFRARNGNVAVLLNDEA